MTPAHDVDPPATEREDPRQNDDRDDVAEQREPGVKDKRGE